MAKTNKTGRDERPEHFTKLIRTTMEEPAWRALSTTAQALYVWLKFEWRGPQSNNNGKIRMSVKQAAERIGVWPDAAARAFHDLQAKGFIVVTEMARLGTSGEASGPAYELTELGTPHGAPEGRKLYRGWSEGNDFPVIKAKANNPKGLRRKQDPIMNIVMLPSRKS